MRVRIDGRGAAPSGAIVADTVGHVLSMTADRALAIPVGAEGLYAAARAVLTATDVPTAFQTYLDAVDAYLGCAPDPAVAAGNVAEVDALAFDLLHDEAALRRVDSALAGYSFRIGPDAIGDPGGTPILNPGDTGVIAYSRRAPIPGRTPSLAPAASDTIEPSVVLYVNGIWTSVASAAETVRAYLEPLVRSIPGFTSGKIAVRYFYNRTLAQQPTTPEERRVDCVRFFGARLVS